MVEEVKKEESISDDDMKKIDKEIQDDSDQKLQAKADEIKEDIKKDIATENEAKETKEKYEEIEKRNEELTKQLEEKDKQIEEYNVQRKGLVSNQSPFEKPKEEEPLTPDRILEITDSVVTDPNEREIMLKKTLGVPI